MNIPDKLLSTIMMGFANAKAKTFYFLLCIFLVITFNFWLIAIFLFARNFFTSHPIWITLVITFGLSTAQIFLCTFLSFFVIDLKNKQDFPVFIAIVCYHAGAVAMASLGFLEFIYCIVDYYIPFYFGLKGFLHNLPFFNFRFFVFVVFAYNLILYFLLSLKIIFPVKR